MTRVQNDSQRLASDYNEEKARLEHRMQELSESARRDAERAAAEYQQKIEDLENRLHQTASTSAAEKADIMRELEGLKRGGRRGGGGIFSMLGRAIDSIFGM